MKNIRNQHAVGSGGAVLPIAAAQWADDQLDYALFCANLWHFLPQTPPQSYRRLYDAILQMQRSQGVGQQVANAPTDIQSSLSATLAVLRQNPGIICTYHTGAYRQICHTLAQEGIPYTLAVSAAVLRREGETLRQNYFRLGSPAGPSGFQLLDAESPGVVRSLLNELNAGRNLLLYVDGNTGAAVGQSRNLMTMPFLNGEIQVRKGIASLSYWVKKPIYPFLVSRFASENAITPLCSTIAPHAGELRDAYERRATTQLYQILASYVERYPEDWECWRYLHHWLQIDHSRYPSGMHALKKYGVAERWHRVVHQGRPYLLDRFSYRLYPV